MSALEVEGQALKALLEAEGKLPSSTASRGTLKATSQVKSLGPLEAGRRKGSLLSTSSSGDTLSEASINGDTGQRAQWSYGEVCARARVCVCM